MSTAKTADQNSAAAAAPRTAPLPSAGGRPINTRALMILGGAVLARQIGPGLPRRFLSARPPAGHWRAFTAYLNQQLADDRAVADATCYAMETFALFEPVLIGVRN